MAIMATMTAMTQKQRGSPGRIQMAMAYLRAGLSINPLNGKVPAVPDWTKFAHQLPTTDHVSVWWHEHPTANLGIVCGTASGVFVLDQDGEQGLQIPPSARVAAHAHGQDRLGPTLLFRAVIGHPVQECCGLLARPRPTDDRRPSGGPALPPCQRRKVRVGHPARAACPRASRHRHSL